MGFFAFSGYHIMDENGREACNLIAQAEPGYYDLVLMDIRMPVMDGYTATRAIRSLDDPKRANLPIIAMTANAFEEDRERAIEAGTNGHLAKSIDVEHMLKLPQGIFSDKEKPEE